MKDIIGHTSYKEITSEELARALYEAKSLRAEAVRDTFIALGRAIGSTAAFIGHKVRDLVDGIVHPDTAGAR